MENYIELEDLKMKLGYKDSRSIKKWCKENRIPIISLGKKKYCCKESLDNYLKKELSQAMLLDGYDAHTVVMSVNSLKKDDKFARETPLSAPIFVKNNLEKVPKKDYNDIINKYK